VAVPLIAIQFSGSPTAFAATSDARGSRRTRRTFGDVARENSCTAPSSVASNHTGRGSGSPVPPATVRNPIRGVARNSRSAAVISTALVVLLIAPRQRRPALDHSALIIPR
jgi:hypothetical protein